MCSLHFATASSCISPHTCNTGALLANFTFNGLLFTVNQAAEKHYIWVYVLLVLSMGGSLTAVLRSIMCSVYGPGLALRGPDGSIKHAVDGMAASREWTHRFFIGSIVLMYLSLIALCCLAFTETWKAVVMALMLAGVLVGTVYSVWKITNIFTLPEATLDDMRFGDFNVETLQPSGANKA